MIAGDLDDVAWSRSTRLLQRISGLVDPRIGWGLFNAFHAKLPLVRWPLNQVFHSPSLRLMAPRRLHGFGSDHFPILVDLSLEPERTRSDRAPVERDGDREAAERKIEESTG